MSKYYATSNVGDTIVEVLNEAAFVLIDHGQEQEWCPVLGYDEYDNVLCLESFLHNKDIVIDDASAKIPFYKVKVAVEVTRD